MVHSLVEYTDIYTLATLARNPVRARTLLNHYPRVSTISTFCFLNSLTTAHSPKCTRIRSVRAMLVVIAMIYTSTCVYTADTLRHIIYTSKHCSGLMVRQLYSTEYPQSCFDKSGLFASPAKNATLFVNVSAAVAESPISYG